MTAPLRGGNDCNSSSPAKPRVVPELVRLLDDE
jgi:hypothetical protein